jgi:hypothetical protein
LSDSVDGTATRTSTVAPSCDDRGAYRLDKISLPAKAFVPATESEIDCSVTSLSSDGANIRTSQASSIGSEIALYIDGFDRFTASVVWTTQDAVGLKFNCSPSKRERTAEKIRCYLEGNPVPGGGSQHARSSAIHSVRNFRRRNGETANFEVIDISLSGASLRTRCRPAIDEIITIGTVEGRVARHFDEGIAVEFTRRT